MKGWVWNSAQAWAEPQAPHRTFIDGYSVNVSTKEIT